MVALSDVITVEWSPSSTPLATSPTWVDIGARVKRIRISRGRSGVFDLFGAGTCSVELDNSNHGISTSTWYRWRQIRVSATASGPTTRRLFWGHVDETVHDQSSAPWESSVNVTGQDVLGLIARGEYAASAVPAEASGARVTRLLNALSVPAGWQSVAAGYAPISALEDGAVNALSHLQDVVEAEVGALFVSAAGVVTFHDRYELLNKLAGASSATFSNTPTGSDVYYLRGSLDIAPPGTDYRNRVVFTGSSGLPQTASNVPAGYPPDGLSRTIPTDDDSWCATNATVLLEWHRQTNTWPTAVTVHLWPNAQNTLDVVSALDLRAYVTAKATPVGSTQQTYKCFVDGIDHDIDCEKSTWRTTLRFSSGDRLQAAWGSITDYLTLDDATYGKLDTGKLAP